MEDKITVTTPVAYLSGSVPTALDRSHPNAYGSGIVGNQALIYNLIQFMVGAPIVNYGSLGIFPATSTSPTGVVSMIDTSRRSADASEYSSLTSSSPYSDFKDSLFQNRANPSAASGIYQIVIQGGAATYTVEDGVGTEMVRPDLSTTSFPFESVQDVYAPNGDFLFALEVTNTPAGGPVGSWTANDRVLFIVSNPSYTDELNWGEVTNTSRLDTNEISNASILLYDTCRGPGNLDTDALDQFYFSGLQIVSNQGQCFFSGVDEVAGPFITAAGDFHALSASGPAITSSVTSGLSYGSTDPALAFRQPNMWTIFRGPGYVRILSQVESPDFARLPILPERDNVYFFGMMKPYEKYTYYNYPMAFLGDSTAASNTIPWWRPANHSANQQTWMDETTGWRYTGPFILNKNFSMDGTLDENEDVHIAAPDVQISAVYPDFDSNSGNVRLWIGGSRDDSVKVYVSPFTGSFREYWNASGIGQACAEAGIAERMHMSNINDRLIQPVTFFQSANDGNGWPTQVNYQPAAPFPLNSYFEAMGALPGIYWVNHRTLESQEIEAGDETQVTVDGSSRTLHTVIGFNSATGNNGAVPAGTARPNHSGNVMFDMGEV